MMKRLSFGVVILVLSMACSRGSSPTSPSPVATPPAPPTASTPKVVALTITASRDVVFVNYTAVLFANAHYDDGSSAPTTPTWETITGPVTLMGNGPVALVTGQGPGIGVITARAAGLSATQFVTVTRQQ
jgi:hypothetical protein